MGKCYFWRNTCLLIYLLYMWIYFISIDRIYNLSCQVSMEIQLSTTTFTPAVVSILHFSWNSIDIALWAKWMTNQYKQKKAEFQFIKNSILTGTIYYSYFQSEVIKTQNHTETTMLVWYIEKIICIFINLINNIKLNIFVFWKHVFFFFFTYF